MQGVAEDLTGRVFGSWTVLQQGPGRSGAGRTWICRCVCGAIQTIRTADLTQGRSRSCRSCQAGTRWDTGVWGASTIAKRAASRRANNADRRERSAAAAARLATRRAAEAPRIGSARRGRLAAELVVMLRLLARGRHRIDDLAAEMGQGRRAAYRILAGLEDSGLQVDHQREGALVYLRASREEIEEWLWTRPITGERTP